MIANFKTLTDSNGIAISNYSMAILNVVYSQPIMTRDSIGYQTILVELQADSDITINMEVSYDNINWYSPQTTDGTDLTDVGQVVANLVASNWIIHAARLSYYTRYKLTANAASGVTLTYLYFNNGNA